MQKKVLQTFSGVTCLTISLHTFYRYVTAGEKVLEEEDEEDEEESMEKLRIFSRSMGVVIK